MATGLATRCSACGTVFRVVPDQLRVSEGWVRCGRCSQVFNALEALVDLETGLPRRTGGGLAPLVQDESPEADFDIAEPAAKPGAPPLPPPPPSTPPPPAAIRAPADIPVDMAADADDAPSSVFGPTLEPADKPSFVRHAERAARWRSRPVRAALWLAGVLAAAGLAAQVGHQYRDLLAARLPETRPWLESACASLGCTVDAARAIDSLAVESSGLVRVERSSLYKLQVSLRNRAGIDVAVPALDVTLTDGQGRLIARKVLRLSELGVAQATIPAGRELAVQATLQAAAGGETGAQPIAGYTIELFYP
jgi:predicted Zn finger-like uncharacterized protein